MMHPTPSTARLDHEPKPTSGRAITRDLAAVAGELAGLRPFPAVVELVRSVAANPASSPADVARLVEGDVGLVTDLLRVVNAPASGLSQRCTSVRHAVSLLGLKRVSAVVTSAAALAFVEHATAQDPALARHSLAVAGVARLLAPIIGLPADEAFTVGLLHDVGSMLVVQTDDPFYEALLEQTAPGEEPSVQDERALMGFDHGALGGEVLRTWHMPAPLPQVVTLHHRWEDALAEGGAVCAMVALIRVAEALVFATGTLAEPRLSDLDRLYEEPAFAYLGLAREEIFNLWAALQKASDRAYVVGDAQPREEPAPAPAPAPAPMAARTVIQPAAEGSQLGLWLGLGAVVATVIVAMLYFLQG
ncbi:MAG TPA: HDOD domain-containing protein [Labilithrix sp.]|nr:HDOD domain-containing protein [Labilithrix sp.]